VLRQIIPSPKSFPMSGAQDDWTFESGGAMDFTMVTDQVARSSKPPLFTPRDRALEWSGVLVHVFPIA
jgi:hypothetical protein